MFVEKTYCSMNQKCSHCAVPSVQYNTASLSHALKTCNIQESLSQFSNISARSSSAHSYSKFSLFTAHMSSHISPYWQRVHPQSLPRSIFANSLETLFNPASPSPHTSQQLYPRSPSRNRLPCPDLHRFYTGLICTTSPKSKRQTVHNQNDNLTDRTAVSSDQ